MNILYILKLVAFFILGVLISKAIRWCVSEGIRQTVRDEIDKKGRR